MREWYRFLIPVAWLAASSLSACSVYKTNDCKGQDHTLCREGQVYWVDSCGEEGDLVDECDCGCDDDLTACETDCPGCMRTADCQASHGRNYYCDLSTNTCVCAPQCIGRCCGDDGCGGVCQNVCPAGTVCDAAACGCVPEDGCPDGELRCSGDLVQLCEDGGWATLERCSGAEICRDGACDPASCQTRDDCAGPSCLVCVRGQCVAPPDVCQGDEECCVGFRCNFGACVTDECECDYDSDCNDPDFPRCSMETCECVPECSTDSDCPLPGSACVGQHCVPLDCTLELCGDGLDNDCDGLIDLLDPDCCGCIEDGNCDDGNQCTVEVCVDCQCIVEPRPDGTGCDDLDDCSSRDACDAGECLAGETDLDADADGHAPVGCPGGDDFDDQDPFNWTAEGCTACVDEDTDGYGQDCDLGPDCDDSDPQVHAGCDAGGKIVFASDRSGRYEVWAVNDDGTGLVQLTFDAPSDIASHGANFPRWSPDGTRIAFNYGRCQSDPGEPDQTRLMLMDADGSGLHEVASGYCNVNTQLAWRAGQAEIITSTQPAICDDAIEGIDLASGDRTLLVDDSTHGYSCPKCPDAHPVDRDLVVYLAYNCGGNDGGLRLRDLSEGTEVALTSPGRADYGPRFSPDGSQIAWYLEQGSVSIYTLALPAGAEVPVTPSPAITGDHIRWVDWTASGFIFGNHTGTTVELWRCDADGADAGPLLGGGHHDVMYDWAPGVLDQ